MRKKLVEQLKEDMRRLGNVELMVKNTLEDEEYEKYDLLDLDLSILKERAKNAIETLEDLIALKEDKQTKKFEVGQKFKMIKHDLTLGQRQAEIISIDGNEAWVRVGKTNYKAEIKDDNLIYPMNMKDYLNTNIKDLI